MLAISFSTNNVNFHRFQKIRETGKPRLPFIHLFNCPGRVSLRSLYIICLFGSAILRGTLRVLSKVPFGLFPVISTALNTLVFGYHHTTGAAKSASLAALSIPRQPLSQMFPSVCPPVSAVCASPRPAEFDYTGYLLHFPYALNTIRCIAFFAMLTRPITSFSCCLYYRSSNSVFQDVFCTN